MSVNEFVLLIDQQTQNHTLLSISFMYFYAAQLAEIHEDINHMLNDPPTVGGDIVGHGLMLGLKLFKNYMSSRTFLEVMLATNGYYADFKCLLQLHEDLLSQVISSTC